MYNKNSVYSSVLVGKIGLTSIFYNRTASWKVFLSILYEVLIQL